MTIEIKKYVSKCDVCLAHQNSHGKEPLQQHEFVARPWTKEAADLCKFHNWTLLVICDYYSNYIQVACLTSLTSKAIIRELKALNARFWSPIIVHSFPVSSTTHHHQPTLGPMEKQKTRSRQLRGSSQNVRYLESQNSKLYWIGATHPLLA